VALERRDDRGRVDDPLRAEVEDRNRPRPGEAQRALTAREERAAPVRDSLVVRAQRAFSLKFENVYCQRTGMPSLSRLMFRVPRSMCGESTPGSQVSRR
jgi:hypothetical protein